MFRSENGFYGHILMFWMVELLMRLVSVWKSGGDPPHPPPSQDAMLVKTGETPRTPPPSQDAILMKTGGDPPYPPPLNIPC